MANRLTYSCARGMDAPGATKIRTPILIDRGLLLLIPVRAGGLMGAKLRDPDPAA